MHCSHSAVLLVSRRQKSALPQSSVSCLRSSTFSPFFTILTQGSLRVPQAMILWLLNSDPGHEKFITQWVRAPLLCTQKGESVLISLALSPSLSLILSPKVLSLNIKSTNIPRNEPISIQKQVKQFSQNMHIEIMQIDVYRNACCITDFWIYLLFVNLDQGMS